MTQFEIAVSIIGTLMTIIGFFSVLFLNRLLKTLDTLSEDVHGIKVEIGKIVTTQTAHEGKFDLQNSRIEKIEERLNRKI